MAARVSSADIIGKELVRISDGLFTKKRPWDQLCQELAENYYPERADFTDVLNLGDDYAMDLYDSYPVMARSQLCDAIDAMLRQGDWFEVGTGDDDRDKKPGNARSLAYVTQILRNVLSDHRVMFAESMKEADHDFGTFGASVTSWQESIDKRSPILRTWHLKDCAWLYDGDLQLSQIHRKVMMTAREIMNRSKSGRWAGEVHKDIVDASKRDPSREFEIRHCVMHSDDVEGGGDNRMEYTSLFYDVEHQMTLSKKGTPFFNYHVSRYRRLGTWPWGFSPVALSTLPNSRTAQALASMVLEQAEKSLDPPLIGAGDIFRNDINGMAGGFTMVDLTDGRLQDKFTVLDTAKNLNVGFEMQQQLHEAIAEGFLLNRLTLPTTQDMTAYEVQQRMDEFRRAALPFFSPIETSHHAPILTNCLRMCFNMRIVDPEALTPDLHGEQVRYRFRSPLNEAEGQKLVAAFNQSVSIIANAMEVDTTVKDVFDIAQAAVDAVQGTGANPTWLLDDDAIAQRKEQNKQLQDASTAADVLQKGALTTQQIASASMAAQAAGLTQGGAGAPA